MVLRDYRISFLLNKFWWIIQQHSWIKIHYGGEYKDLRDKKILIWFYVNF